MTVKDKVCDFKNLYEAMWECSSEVKWKDSVTGYLMHGLQNTYKLKQELENGTYKISPYAKFEIYEPKKRSIVSTKFKDRQFQKSLTDNYLYDELTNSFIYDNHACQIYRGTDSARDRLSVMMHKFYRKHKLNGYYLKADIHDFFGSTDHALLKEAVRKRIDDDWAYSCVEKVIDSYDGETGIGLGSQITQLIQLAFLDELDHIIKERLHIKYYIRYMDDFILFHEDKEYLKYCKKVIGGWIEEHKLELNPNKTFIAHVKQKIRWLGFNYRLTDTGKVLMTLPKDKVKHEMRKLKKQVKKAKNGEMTKKQVDSCFTAFKSHARRSKSKHKKNYKRKRTIGKAQTYYEVRRLEKFYNSLWKEEEYV